MSQDKIQKARELVLNYIATHTLSDKLNRAVNEVCRSRPKDPWLFLADIISEWSKDVPMIDRLVAKQGIDCYGNSSIQLQLFGRVSNARPPRYLAVENVFVINPINTNANNTQEEKKENEKDECIKSMMQKVSEYLSPALRSIRIDEQTKIDNELYKLYSDGLEEESSSSKLKQFNIIPIISSLMAITTSNYLRIPLYKYLSKTKTITNTFKTSDDDNDDMDYILPNIMCEIIKTISNILPSIHIITTNNKRPLDRILMITNITNALINILKTNNKSRNISFDNNTGAILLEDTDCTNMEQLLSLVYRAVKTCNGKYEINKDLSFGLSFVSNPSCLVYTKQKEYILNGEKQTTDDIIEYFNGIIQKYKGIEYLEDPLNNKDGQTYAVLNDKQIQTKSNVTIIGNGLYDSLHEEIRKGIKNAWSNGVMLMTSKIFTLTKAFNISNMIQECNGNKKENRVVLMMNDINGMNTYGIDLAIACGAHIIKLALPNSGKSVDKYNRWLMIADELSIEVVNYDQQMNGGNVNTDGVTQNMETIDEQNNNNEEVEQNVGSDADKADLP